MREHVKITTTSAADLRMVAMVTTDIVIINADLLISSTTLTSLNVPVNSDIQVIIYSLSNLYV